MSAALSSFSRQRFIISNLIVSSSGGGGHCVPVLLWPPSSDILPHLGARRPPSAAFIRTAVVNAGGAVSLTMPGFSAVSRLSVQVRKRQRPREKADGVATGRFHWPLTPIAAPDTVPEKGAGFTMPDDAAARFLVFNRRDGEGAVGNVRTFGWFASVLSLWSHSVWMLTLIW